MSSVLLSLCFGDAASGNESGGSKPRQISEHEVDITPVSRQDAELLSRLRFGNPEALDEIMLAYFNQLTRFANSIIHDHAGAEDIVQDLFTRLWTRRGSLQISSLKTYLYTSVRNAALNVIKGKSGRAKAEEPIRDELIHNLVGNQLSGEVADEDPRIVLIRAALATLPERRRTALQLRYEQELSYPEVASILGISINATQQLVFHALQMLRKALSAPGIQEP